MTVEMTLPKLKHPRPLLQRSAVHYPDSDGEPMAENDAQYLCLTDTRFALDIQFKDQPNVYVAADILVYYAEGDPTKSVAPDVLVAFDVPKGIRRSYRIWDEGKAPDVIFEIASEGTWRADVTWKRGLYMGLGVREYFLFDPTATYFKPLLQGFCERDTLGEPCPPLPPVRGERGLRSNLLGLELWARRNDNPDMPYVLRLYDPAAETWLPTPMEAAERAGAEAAARQAAERQTEIEAAARRKAEAEIERLQAELARLRGEA
ncbi:MAG: Uma2 family endonuclease [Chloroflexota bacterium]